MQLVIQNFHDRIAEVEAYIDFVVRLEKGYIRLQNLQESEKEILREDDLLRTFKAIALLMLYNLMESSVTNAIEAIFDELGSGGVTFDECRDEVRLVVLRNLKKRDPEKILPNLVALTSDIITKSFEKTEIFSGNVDAREIREVAKKYGFTVPGVRSDRMLTVKACRNDLAHGVKSFSEVGKDFSADDISALKTEVVSYLTELLKNISAYLTSKHYLAV